ncbi:hypothetical protein KFK14_13380 [Sphingobium phenoxybenzoativorans]|uniref:Uncharacterized protein n=1 Tax=Sphingobium phenoxybenzoativorans TaxID=1592790 RepID=A0A975K605_9SPHN|nr:hypothetical protein [Sphingobium phenoxybenzoativorans]QUT04132.1 hypothetical protein KFK14_13380 [Sphingobium phenoxybenzoativorans]
MDRLVSMPTKGGTLLGKKMAARFDASSADALYKKLREKGERDASYAMQVCRLVWRWAVRHHKITGVKENPFAGMGIKSVSLKGNRETSREEYDLYRKTARAMGYQSMATAAALCFECCQRVWDVFGLKDDDGEEHAGIPWENYQPGKAISVIQSKTGNPVWLELTTDVPAEGGGTESAALYPELEEELEAWAAKARRGADGNLTGIIIREERNGEKYKHRRMSKVHREICDEAGLPTDMTFTGFRHGGITEIGASGEADVRPISGHKTLAVTAIYNKATAEKGRRIALKRREHIEKLIDKNEDLSE